MDGWNCLRHRIGSSNDFTFHNIREERDLKFSGMLCHVDQKVRVDIVLEDHTVLIFRIKDFFILWMELLCSSETHVL
jgi:hypothetical protein